MTEELYRFNPEISACDWPDAVPCRQDQTPVSGAKMVWQREDTLSEELLVPTIAWPFIISGAWCIIFSFGFLVLAKLPYKVRAQTRVQC